MAWSALWLRRPTATAIRQPVFKARVGFRASPRVSIVSTTATTLARSNTRAMCSLSVALRLPPSMDGRFTSSAPTRPSSSSGAARFQVHTTSALQMSELPRTASPLPLGRAATRALTPATRSLALSARRRRGHTAIATRPRVHKILSGLRAVLSRVPLLRTTASTETLSTRECSIHSEATTQPQSTRSARLPGRGQALRDMRPELCVVQSSNWNFPAQISSAPTRAPKTTRRSRPLARCARSFRGRHSRVACLPSSLSFGG